MDERERPPEPWRQRQTASERDARDRLVRIEANVEHTARAVDKIERKLDSVGELAEVGAALRDRVARLEKIVFGAVALVLMAFAGLAINAIMPRHDSNGATDDGVHQAAPPMRVRP